MSRRRKEFATPLDSGEARPLLYSRTCQFALRAMERLAAASLAGAGLQVQSRLAKETGIPAASLAQILHRLRNAGLVAARRGPAGGVGLARPARLVTVLQVVRAIDGAGVEGRCVLGFAACRDETPCPAHPVWKPAKELLNRQLESRTLEDLVRSVRRKRAAIRRRS